jgi:hypothetical protein
MPSTLRQSARLREIATARASPSWRKQGAISTTPFTPRIPLFIDSFRPSDFAMFCVCLSSTKRANQIDDFRQFETQLAKIIN